MFNPNLGQKNLIFLTVFGWGTSRTIKTAFIVQDFCLDLLFMLKKLH
jgi:hypothetical protein